MLTFLFISLWFHTASSVEYDVLILGAGASGIGAALYLHNHNVKNFLVLEAKDYVGGRMKSATFQGETVELGAGWVHDATTENVIYQLAKEDDLNLVLDSYELDNVAFRNAETGLKYSDAKVKAVASIFKKQLVNAGQLMKKRIEDGGYGISVETALRWTGWRNKRRINQAIEYFGFDFNSGVDPARFTASYLINQSEFGFTKDYIVRDKRGYSYVLDAVSKPFKGKIYLNTEVKSIKRLPENTYEVTVNNGMKLTAKHVLVTFSSGVLLSEYVKFVPSLPAWKIEALSMAPLGDYCKIFVQFPTKFWDDTGYIMLATKIRGQYMHWQNLENLFPNKNLLLATLTGEKCQESRLQSDKEIKDEMFTVLKKIYPNATEPSALIRYLFETDPHFLGSFSYQVPGMTDDDRVALSHPVSQSLWFAGGYANGWDFGTVQFAFTSGEKTAKRLIGCLQNNVCPDVEPKRKCGKHSGSNPNTGMSAREYHYVKDFSQSVLSFLQQFQNRRDGRRYQSSAEKRHVNDRKKDEWKFEGRIKKEQEEILDLEEGQYWQ